MTVKEYITDKFQSFGVRLSGADFMDISMMVPLDDEMTTDNRDAVYYALAKTVIPHFLLNPQSYSEGDMSVSRNMDALIKYHSWLCNELSIDNSLNLRPSIRFI